MPYTYHIQEEIDARIGRTFYLYCRHIPDGEAQLIGEYSTRAEAREGMRRAVERDRKSMEGFNGKERSLD
jgi:hypothetical protein